MNKRAQVRAELDAYYARLYVFTRDELRYTPYGVDPKEVHGEDFPGETFRVLKEKEVRLIGDAPRRRMPRLVMAAWDYHSPGRRDLVAQIAGRVLIAHASEGQFTRSEKSDRVEVEYLGTRGA